MTKLKTINEIKEIKFEENFDLEGELATINLIENINPFTNIKSYRVGLFLLGRNLIFTEEEVIKNNLSFIKKGA